MHPSTAFKRALFLRCPVCGTGKPFRGIWGMQADCPSCRFHFEREPGYFVGAMYFGYGLAMISLAPAMLAALVLDLTMRRSMALAITQLILTSPWIFRWARLLWIALDTSFSPPLKREYRMPESGPETSPRA